jgi:squalene synthase HpnC
MAQAGAENFTVASLLLPREQRRDLLAIYGFARLVDDVSDEAPGDRGALIDWLEQEVERMAAGAPTHPLTAPLARTLRDRAIPPDPLRALVGAARRDQEVSRYETFDDLLGYCALSANPVGQLVLYVFGAATPERMHWSDAVCSALQVAEHCQDVAEDRARGRVYLPQEDLRRFGCSDSDLDAPHASDGVRAAVALQIQRARALLADGVPLVRSLRGRPALAIAGFVAGGRAALEAVERAGCDVLAGTPRATRTRRAVALLATLAEARRR